MEYTLIGLVQVYISIIYTPIGLIQIISLLNIPHWRGKGFWCRICLFPKIVNRLPTKYELAILNYLVFFLEAFTVRY